MKILAVCLLNFLAELLVKLQICKKTKLLWLRFILLALPCAWFVTAAIYACSADALRHAAAQAYLVFGLCALVGYGAAWLVKFLGSVLSSGGSNHL